MAGKGQLRAVHWGWGGCRGRHPFRAGKIFRRWTPSFPETVLAPARRENFPTSWAKPPPQGGFGSRPIDRRVNLLHPNKRKDQRITARMADGVSLLPFRGYACAGPSGGWFFRPAYPACVYPAQETDHFFPAHSPQFEDQERIAVKLFTQQIVDCRDVFAGIRPVRAGTFCLQILQFLGKEFHACASEDFFNVLGHLAGEEFGRKDGLAG